MFARGRGRGRGRPDPIVNKTVVVLKGRNRGQMGVVKQANGTPGVAGSVPCLFCLRHPLTCPRHSPAANLLIDIHALSKTVTIPREHVKMYDEAMQAVRAWVRACARQCMSALNDVWPVVIFYLSFGCCCSQRRAQSKNAGARRTTTGRTPTFGGRTPNFGGRTPNYGGATPFDGGATPFDGGATPFDGGATPFDGAATPFDGAATPFDGGATPFGANTSMCLYQRCNSPFGGTYACASLCRRRRRVHACVERHE